jgi:hypothetical protein
MVYLLRKNLFFLDDLRGVIYQNYRKSKSFLEICRGSARVPTPHQLCLPLINRGNHGGIAPTLIV